MIISYAVSEDNVSVCVSVCVCVFVCVCLGRLQRGHRVSEQLHDRTSVSEIQQLHRQPSIGLHGTHTHTHTHTQAHLINLYPATQDDSAADNVVGSKLCSACAAAQWKHDESVQLRRFWDGGGEGPNPILIGLRHPEGGAARQSLSLWGNCFSTQGSLWPVSDGECVNVRLAATMSHAEPGKMVYVCAFLTDTLKPTSCRTSQIAVRRKPQWRRRH